MLGSVGLSFKLRAMQMKSRAMHMQYTVDIRNRIIRVIYHSSGTESETD